MFEGLPKYAPVPKILTLDIETKPMTVYSWGLFNQNHSIDQIVGHGGMICFAAKWLGSKEVLFYSDFHDGYETMVQAAHGLLSEADIVIGYNSDRFDIKKINNEFFKSGLKPPRPFKSIDLIKTNKGRFDLPSRKLDYLVRTAGIGKKVTHTGFQLWLDCMAGDPAAWELMKRYCIGDVKVTEKAYLTLLPWLTNAPHLGMWTGEIFSCPYCGGKRLERAGIAHTLVQQYELYQCQSKHCGGWVRGVTRKQDPTRTRAIR